jgi:tetratricopeptide (TPR) repeat protein
MRELERRLAELRQRLQTAKPDEMANLERQARELLTDAKNTDYEEQARQLYTEMAQQSRRETAVSESDPVVRGMLRRARIRIEMAGDEDDIDDAIDILTDALASAPNDVNVIETLQQAASQSPQAAHRVRDLFNRYGVSVDVQSPSTTQPSTPSDSTPNPYASTDPKQPTQTPYTPADATAPSTPSASSNTDEIPAVNGDTSLDGLLTQLNESYYAGDYQQTVDIANRILALDPNNQTAQEYRAKSEDNIVRGIVPDHRIPFEARVAYNRANSLVRAGNYDEASRLYQEAREVAERSGILNWKDVEQALLDIQDLALARELLNEGDRFMATDNWNGSPTQVRGCFTCCAQRPSSRGARRKCAPYSARCRPSIAPT